MKRARVLMANEAALMRTDPFPILVLFVTPTLFLLFLANGLAIGPTGAVAGVTTVFGYIGLSVVGVAMFRDHGWHTHDRYRASPLRVSEYFAGKSVPLFVLFTVQKLVLLAVGWVVVDMPWRIEVWAVPFIVLTTAAAEVAIGLALVAVCTNIHQLNGLSNLGGLVIVGLGGGLSAVAALPGWAQAIAPASPAYWSVRALRAIGDGSAGDAMEAVAVLVAVVAAALSVVAARYRMDEPKEYYA